MIKVLITGFEPQWGLIKSPSGELAKVWASGHLNIDNVEVRGIVLPQIFGKSFDVLKAEAISQESDLILMFGATQHEGPIRLERFAVNIIDTTLGDNSKIPILDTKILHDGPAGFETDLPIKSLVTHLKGLGINVVPSYSAGSHSCNDVFYRCLHWISSNPLNKPVRACFIHVSIPNSFGVVEDRSQSTPDFNEIIRFSIELIKYLANTP